MDAEQTKVIDKIFKGSILTERQRSILYMRVQGMTLQQIGDHFNLSRERIRQLMGSITRKLEDYLNEEELIILFRTNDTEESHKRKRHRIENYVSNWKGIRKEVLERDKRICQSCGRDTKGQIHHIKPRGQGGGHELSNLTTLCGKCHMIISDSIPNHVIEKKFRLSEDDLEQERKKIEKIIKSKSHLTIF